VRANEGLRLRAIVRRRAACPSAERMTKVRSLAESHSSEMSSTLSRRGTEILACEVAADIIENLSKRSTLGVKLSIERSHGCGDLPGYTSMLGECPGVDAMI
jgi:hypothetical protein